MENFQQGINLWNQDLRMIATIAGLCASVRMWMCGFAAITPL
jgi:hypothetical protein